ncbi:MAG TPA: glycosyltransferase [Acidimicrobiales bacterium]|nr:glycosyltransferase [Acidimicrobiales bacterium]
MTEGGGSGTPPLVSVITPAYREGARIFESLSLLRSSLDGLALRNEIILVSDGSDDQTVDEASRHADVRVLHYPEQRGKGYAIRHGITHAKGDVIAFIDSDMELHPDGIGRLVELVLAGADAAIGSKRHPESKVSYPLFRRIQSRAYQRLVRALFGLELTDTQTGLKAFRASVLREVAASLASDGFAFDLELLVGLKEAGATIVEGPVELDYAFDTTTSLRAVIDVLADTLRIYRRHRRSTRHG